MTIKLYYNKSDDRNITKDLQLLGTLTGQLRDECSVVDPSIALNIDQSKVDMSLVNYFEIPEFHRKYFMKSPAIFINGIWKISGHCDILSSSKDYLLVKAGYVDRQEAASAKLNDEMSRTYADPIITTKKFPHGMGTPNYILTVVSSTPSQVGGN